MTAPLAPYLTPEHLREVAGPAVYARAQQYVEEGRVRLRPGPKGTLQGEVDGSRAYTVALEVGPAGLLSTCDCPWARAHGPCKHGVALGLAFLAAGAAPTTGERPSADAHPRGPEATEAWVDLHQVGHARHLALRALLPHLGARTVDRLVFLLPQEASVVDAAAGRVAQSLGRLARVLTASPRP